MPRQPILALGLAALALSLALGLGTCPGPAAAEATRPRRRRRTTRPPPAGSTAEAEVGSPRRPSTSSAPTSTPGEPNILEPQPSLAIWTVVVFVGLLLVLGKFAWKPLLAALHGREEHLEHVLLETERARNESEQLLAEHRRRLAAAEDQIRAMIEEARRNAQAIADEIVKKAQAEADASRQRAQREIETARDQALSEIWTKTADLAVSVAGKMLDKSLTEDDHRRLVDAAVGELPAVRPSNGHGGARGMSDAQAAPAVDRRHGLRREGRRAGPHLRRGPAQRRREDRAG